MAKRSFYVKDSELDDYQVKVINKKTDNSYIVKGCAGSGKSILALWKAKQIQDEHKGTYLYIVFTKALMQYMADGISQVGIPQRNVDYHWHWQNRAGCPSADYIIVDEAQDFSKEDIELFRSKAKKALLLYGDSAQQLYTFIKDKQTVSMEDIQYFTKFPVEQLVFNHRLPKKIEKLDLKHPFSMTFYLYLGSQGKMAADGITFTLQTKGDSWLGNSGQSLGVYSGNDNPKQDLLSLEFDTFYNGDRADDNDFNYPIKGIKDLFNGHIAFRTSGSAKDPHYGIVDTIEKKDFSNGSWKKVNIDYTPNALGTGTIRYDYIDLGNGIKRNASLTFNYDGKGKVPAFKGISEVFWGFTSATGELWAENAIAFDALPVQGKVEAKDSSIYVGQKWSPSDNFVSGKDTFGKPLDVKDLRIYVDGKLNGTLDTSKPGVHKVKYEYVVKTNGLPDQIFDKEVTVTVLQTTQVKSKPQVLRYIDNDSSKFNAKDFVTVADDKGKPLSNYTARFLSFPNSLNGKEAVVEVTDTHGQVFTVKVPVTYKLGNTINLLGRSDDRVATFSLDDAGKNIVATYNYASGNTKIHRDFSDTYYSFSHFWQKTLNSGSLNTQNPDYIFSAKGTDLLNTLDQFDGDRILGVSPGDVIKINHKEGGHLLQNYVNNASEGDSPAKEMLYEITTKGFKTLALNRLIPVDSVVLQGASKADLDKNLSTYLPVNGNVKMVGFKTYPDVNKRGNSTGVITVKEELSIGKSVTWDYAVKFNVQRKFDSVTAKKTGP